MLQDYPCPQLAAGSGERVSMSLVCSLPFLLASCLGPAQLPTEGRPPADSTHLSLQSLKDDRHIHLYPPCTLLCLHTARAPAVGSQAQSCLTVHLRHGGGKLFRARLGGSVSQVDLRNRLSGKNKSIGLTSHSSIQPSHPAAPCWAVCLPPHHGIGLTPLTQEKLELPGKNLTLPGLGPT